MRDPKTGRYVPGARDDTQRRGGLRLQRRIRAERALLADIWARRATASETGDGYMVTLDAELCARIRAALEDAR
jgi:hypothetical protein